MFKWNLNRLLNASLSLVVNRMILEIYEYNNNISKVEGLSIVTLLKENTLLLWSADKSLEKSLQIIETIIFTSYYFYYFYFYYYYYKFFYFFVFLVFKQVIVCVQHKK